MATYTQTDGTDEGTKYFQDVEVSPVTLASGELAKRLDTKAYPKLGVKTLTNPTITDVSDTVAEGTTADVVVSGHHFVQGATVAFSGAGITVNSVSNTDHLGHELVVNVTVAEGAAQTARNVTVTNPDGGAATSNGAITVALGIVTITGVAPATKAEGTTSDIVISGTGFEAGAAATFSGAGITVNSTTVNSPTQVTANITVAGGAAHTARDVTLTNTDTTAATATGALTITA